MAALSDSELEKMVNEVALQLEFITDEQAEDSEIGGDSDADDDLPLQSLRSSNTSTPSGSDQANEEENIMKRKASLEHHSDTDNEEEKRRHGEEQSQQTQNDNLVCSDSEEENVREDEDEYDWEATGKVPKLFANSNYNQPFGPKRIIDNYRSPIDYFTLFFSNFLMGLIIEQTELYASQKNQTISLDLPELKAFLGLLVYMGFHSLPSIRLYWSTDENFHCDRIARVMSLKRFLKLLRLLHLADNSNMPKRSDPNYDKLYKVRPLLNILSKEFPKHFSPSRYISIDESMVAFKGRSSMKQYMPLKPIKRGFKIWLMCCAVTGYIVAFDVYIGKDEKRPAEMNLGEYVVYKLSAALEGFYYCLFFDNFFTSILLLKRLLAKKLFGCGTIRQNRKYFPEAMKKVKLDAGEFTSVQADDFSISQWRDRGKKPVSVASTMHNSDETTKVRRTTKTGEKQELACPKSIADYNAYMGGVDRLDQLLAAYSVAQKSRRWWLKIFYYFLDCSIVNGYIIYKETMKSKNLKPASQLTFRSNLVNELIGTFCSKKRTGYYPYKGFARKNDNPRKKTKVENTVRLSDVGVHIPKKIQKRRRCAYCSTKTKEKRSDLLCEKCNVALCKDCFAKFHNK